MDLGTQFDAILPALWLASGAVGKRKTGEDSPKRSHSRRVQLTPYCSNESAFRKAMQGTGNGPDITHVWIVTDSEDAFAEMRSALPSRLATSMLYRDYLRNFRINTRQNL